MSDTDDCVLVGAGAGAGGGAGAGAVKPPPGVHSVAATEGFHSDALALKLIVSGGFSLMYCAWALGIAISLRRRAVRGASCVVFQLRPDHTSECFWSGFDRSCEFVKRNQYFRSGIQRTYVELIVNASGLLPTILVIPLGSMM